MPVPPIPEDRQDGTTIRAAHVNQLASGVNDLQQQINDLPPGGYSAYELWLQDGNSGTVEDFLESLRGPASTVPGPEGDVSTAGIGPGGVGFRPQGDIADWFDRLAAATTIPVDVVVIGDSIAAQGSIADPAWPWLLGRAMARRADTPDPTDQLVYAAPSSSVPSVSGPGGTLWAGGFGGFGTTLATGESLAHAGTCDAVSVLWGRQSGGGTLTIRDGGPSGTVLTTLDTSGAERASQQWTSDSLTYGHRTLHLAASGGPVRVEALYLHRDTRTRGVRVWPAVHHGWTSEQFTSTPGLALDLIADLDAAGTLGLVVVATGTNDDAPATRVAALLDAVQAVTSAPVAQWVGFRNNQLTRTEIADLRQLAVDRGSLLIDADTYAPRFGYQYTADGTHPIQQAQAILARHAEAILSGDPIGTIIRDAPRLGTSAFEAAPGDILTAINRSTWTFVDDFILGDAATSGSIGDHGWTRTGGISTAGAVGITGHAGVVQFQANAGTTAALAMPMYITDDAGATFRVSYWAMVQVGGGTHTFRLGLNAAPEQPALGTFFEVQGSDVYLVTHDFLGGGEIARTPAGTIDSAWHEWTIYQMGAGAWGLIDGALVATVPVSRIASPWIAVTASGGTATARIDRCEVALTGIPRTP